jgi:hypothetical protein
MTPHLRYAPRYPSSWTLEQFFADIPFFDLMLPPEREDVAARLTKLKGWSLPRARRTTNRAWTDARRSTFYYFPQKVAHRHGLKVWLARESRRRAWIAGASYGGIVLVWFVPWQHLKKEAALRKFAAICKHFGLVALQKT